MARERLETFPIGSLKGSSASGGGGSRASRILHTRAAGGSVMTEMIFRKKRVQGFTLMSRKGTAVAPQGIVVRLPQ